MKLVFVGRVLPDYVAFSYSKPIQLHSESGLGEEVESTLSVQRGKLALTVSLKQNTNIDLEALRYYAESLTRAVVDSYGFAHGAAFDAEITACVHESGEQAVFGCGLDELRLDSMSPEAVLATALLVPQLQRALADYRLAIQNPHDTAFYCYRAIESLCGFYCQASDYSDKVEAWERLRAALDLTKEQLTEFKGLADLQRHGMLIAALDNEERLAALRRTSDVLCRFVEAVPSNNTEA